MEPVLEADAPGLRVGVGEAETVVVGEAVRVAEAVSMAEAVGRGSEVIFVAEAWEEAVAAGVGEGMALGDREASAAVDTLDRVTPCPAKAVVTAEARVVVKVVEGEAADTLASCVVLDPTTR